MTQVSESRDAVSGTRLPLLFVSDLVVLPGMVVSIELDEPRRPPSTRHERAVMAGFSWLRGSRTGTRRTA